ncbi:MAG TPA: hypothetical protein VHE61_17230, partial [Opitutaceae bacterium]|nr:hypothetical protein [Opitutaceae bacterium]
PIIHSPIPNSPASVPLAVIGAHLSGMPLNHQLTDRGGRMVWSGRTAPQYRLYALPGTTPPKPGMIRVAEGGAAIEVEVWEVPTGEFGSFVALVPSPLCIGSITLESGAVVKSFLCESAALDGARDISEFGGWREYMKRGLRSADAGSSHR